MVAGKDIYRISVPLAAGVCAAAILFSRMDNASEWRYLVAGTIPLVLALALFPALHDRQSAISRNPALWWSVFFALGTFCFSTAGIIAPGAYEDKAFGNITAKLVNLISRMPFKDGENNALAQALILGDKSHLSRSTISDFRTAGAAHLLALSGMHLGIIYLAINRILMIFGNSIPVRKIRNIVTVCLCGFYTLLCGAGASLVRAWLFIALNETAKFLDRPQPPQQIFCAALTLHLIFKPGSIVDIGFQLSYLAMVGIVFVWPWMREWYNEKGLGRKIWEAASLSICCQLFTAPLTLIYFGTFPKYFLITNLVASPLMGIVMGCGVVSLCTEAAFGHEGCLWLFNVCEVPFNLLRSLLEIIAGVSII